MRKSIRCLSVLALVICIATLSFAQTPSAPASTTPATNQSMQPLTPEEEAHLREDAQLMLKVLGVAGEADASSQQPGQHKTVADVLDKLLDMTSGFVVTTAARLEQVAPHVWRIMIMQQYAKAIGDMTVPWGLLILALIYMKIVNRAWKPKAPDGPLWNDRDGGPTESGMKVFLGKFAPIFLGFIFAIWGLNNLSESIKLLINPEYYAIHDMLTMALGRTAGM